MGARCSLKKKTVKTACNQNYLNSHKQGRQKPRAFNSMLETVIHKQILCLTSLRKGEESKSLVQVYANNAHQKNSVQLKPSIPQIVNVLLCAEELKRDSCSSPCTFKVRTITVMSSNLYQPLVPEPGCSLSAATDSSDKTNAICMYTRRL